MKVRQEQIDALEEVRLPEFESAMVSHLRDFSPLHGESLGESGLRTFIQAGVANAAGHGFTQRGPVRFFIETSVLLGIGFDTDPQYPQIASILADRSTSDQALRADRVYDWLMTYLDAVGGHNREHAYAALKRIREQTPTPVAVSDPDFEQAVLKQMVDTHPEKVAFVGEDVLRGLVPRALEETNRFSVRTDLGVCLFIGLMFAVGHKFYDDPKYPWVKKTLLNPAISDANKRAERLYSKTMTYLDFVLQNKARRN